MPLFASSSVSCILATALFVMQLVLVVRADNTNHLSGPSTNKANSVGLEFGVAQSLDLSLLSPLTATSSTPSILPTKEDVLSRLKTTVTYVKNMKQLCLGQYDKFNLTQCELRSLSQGFDDNHEDASLSSSSSSCANLDPLCTLWAARGDCQANRDFMASTCAPTCHLCFVYTASRGEPPRDHPRHEQQPGRRFSPQNPSDLRKLLHTNYEKKQQSQTNKTPTNSTMATTQEDQNTLDDKAQTIESTVGVAQLFHVSHLDDNGAEEWATLIHRDTVLARLQRTESYVEELEQVCTGQNDDKDYTLSHCQIHSLYHVKSGTVPAHPESSSSCVNQDPWCTVWAIRGDCESNPTQMAKTCAPTCQACMVYTQTQRSSHKEDMEHENHNYRQQQSQSELLKQLYANYDHKSAADDGQNRHDAKPDSLSTKQQNQSELEKGLQANKKDNRDHDPNHSNDDESKRNGPQVNDNVKERNQSDLLTRLNANYEERHRPSNGNKAGQTFGVAQRLNGLAIGPQELQAKLDETARYMQQHKLADCTNNDPLCTFWFLRGECQANAEFVLPRCGPACQSCTTAR